tara:strand:- start:1004 stop:1153 length:150 start_codon:yes stop_codon:yes gene_type:complete
MVQIQNMMLGKKMKLLKWLVDVIHINNAMIKTDTSALTLRKVSIPQMEA